MITAYQAKFIAYNITAKYSSNNIDRLSQSLFDASVDLKPHQMRAALFAMNQPLNQGVILADEVGLGKTIEASLVICQYWAELRRKIIIVCPASLRKQWESELSDKFNIPSEVIDNKRLNAFKKQGINPFEQRQAMIVSYDFIRKYEEQFMATHWDLVVIDEVHNLRNVMRGNKRAVAIQNAFRNCKKLLLTATPVQNNIREVYGLMQFVGDDIFSDERTFVRKYGKDNNIENLKERLAPYMKRTLRRDVLQYIQYTKRHSHTIEFHSTQAEQQFYHALNDYLARLDINAISKRARHLTIMVLRKLMESSTHSVIYTLEKMLARLREMQMNELYQPDVLDELEDDIIDEIDEEFEDLDNDEDDLLADEEIKPMPIADEIKLLSNIIAQAKNISVESKTQKLIPAIEQAFAVKDKLANRRVIIFTESTRTQDYLREHLLEHGYDPNKVIVFNGNNNSEQSNAIYRAWIDANPHKASGSMAIDKRKALLDYFEKHAEVMIATEAAAEGLNLQFCSIIINYDLPWNPQRVEQRIGRCHRYGQKYDVVVINFLNGSNEAAQRIYELMSEKLKLFDGVFGASDEVLGRMIKGIDFEREIYNIINQCRTPQEIKCAFDDLQQRCDDIIKVEMNQTYDLLLENFDENIQEVLRIDLEKAKSRLNTMNRLLWLLVQYTLQDDALFDFGDYSFEVIRDISDNIQKGHYRFLHQNEDYKGRPFRLNSPLGEHVIHQAQQAHTEDSAEIIFKYQDYRASEGTRLTLIEKHLNQSGYLVLSLLTATSDDGEEEHLVFSINDDTNQPLSTELAEQIMRLPAILLNENIDFSNSSVQHLLKDHACALEAKRNEIAERQNALLTQEEFRIDQWYEDQSLTLDHKLADVKDRLKEAKKLNRSAANIQEKMQTQEMIRQCEQEQRKLRRSLFELEDELETKRDEMIERIHERLAQSMSAKQLMVIRWRLK